MKYMKIFNNFDEYTKSEPLFLTIGFFDGVHLGHQKILKNLVKKAKSAGCPSALITFSFHPLKLLNYSHGKLLIMPFGQKLNCFDRLGVDYAFVLDFNKHVVDMRAKDFTEKILAKKLKVKKLYIGEDFRFGKDRRGDIKLLADPPPPSRGETPGQLNVARQAQNRRSQGIDIVNINEQGRLVLDDHVLESRHARGDHRQ